MVQLRSLRRRNADSCEIRSYRAVAFQIKQARKSKGAKEAVPPSASPIEQQALRKAGSAVPTAIQNLKRVRDRLLDGWIVSCLLLIIIQVIIFAVALSFGIILGFGYLVYCLFRMTYLKKRAKKNEGR